MKVYRIDSYTGPAGLGLYDEPDPGTPTGHQVVVRVRASSLNYRELLDVQGALARMLPLPERRIPGSDAAGEVLAVGPDVTREWVTELPSYETEFDGDLVEAMNAALLAADPESRTVPYMLSGGTDAKHFARLGIRCFGFIPLRLPPELDFAALFHGVDERVPIDALEFGARVLERFLTNC